MIGQDRGPNMDQQKGGQAGDHKETPSPFFGGCQGTGGCTRKGRRGEARQTERGKLPKIIKGEGRCFPTMTPPTPPLPLPITTRCTGRTGRALKHRSVGKTVKSGGVKSVRKVQAVGHQSV